MSAKRDGGRSVALVHDWLTGMRGGEKVLEEIASPWPEAPIYTLFHFPGSVSGELERHPIRTSWLRHAPGLRRHYRSYLPFFPRAIESFDLRDFDLVISTSHCVAKGVLTGSATRHVCYCHTPMRYAWDQQRAYFPDDRGPVGLLRSEVLRRLRRWDVETSLRVDLFLANSSFVAERIRRYYGRHAEVVPPPVDTEFFTPGDDDSTQPESGPYCLAVAALAPYKRIDLAIEACRSLGVRLVVVGTGPEHARLERLGGAHVELRGRVEGAELRQLYREATCFVQPGIEDFGIAAVEALACGTPVVALGMGGVTDIVRDGRDGVLYAPGVDGDSTSHSRETPGHASPDLAQALTQGAELAALDDRERARHLRALTTAIDRARQLRFNKLDLRRQAETFSSVRFRSRMREWTDPGETRPADRA